MNIHMCLYVCFPCSTLASLQQQQQQQLSIPPSPIASATTTPLPSSLHLPGMAVFLFTLTLSGGLSVAVLFFWHAYLVASNQVRAGAQGMETQ